jgi:hypothetical protein
MKYIRNKADPCLYFAWTATGLIIWLSWVDDCLVTGKKEGVLSAKRQMMDRFDCDEVGELKEYVGCKIDYIANVGSVKITQPVLLQSFKDEFELPGGDVPITPAVPGDVLRGGEPKDYVTETTMSKYRSGVGKLLHVMKWSRPVIMKCVRELSRFMSSALGSHVQAMYRTMKYCIGTPNRGLLLKPDSKWNGDPNFEFTVTGKSDSDYAKDSATRRSVTGYSTFLNGAPVSMKSRMQSCVTLSVTEAELVSGTQCAQDMLYIMRVLESMGLRVKKPMILHMDNKGAIDLTHNWSVGGRTRHVDVRYYFLRDLKEENVIRVVWIPSDDNCSDIFTKNLAGPKFEKHTAVFCGVDEYMKNGPRSQGEGVPDPHNSG